MDNSQRIKNYYDSIRNLYSNLFNSFESSLKGGMAGSVEKGQAEKVKKQLGEFLDNLENMALKQQERLDNMTPEEYKQESLNSLNQFEEFFDKGYQQVKEGIQKEREYINSPQFEEDSKNQVEQSQKMMNGMLDAFTNMFNSLNQGVK